MYCLRFSISLKKKGFDFGWNRTRVLTLASSQRRPLGHTFIQISKIFFLYIFIYLLFIYYTYFSKSSSCFTFQVCQLMDALYEQVVAYRLSVATSSGQHVNSFREEVRFVEGETGSHRHQSSTRTFIKKLQ